MTNQELTEGQSRDTKRESGGSRAQRWDAFINVLSSYIEEHHHGPVKHTSLLNSIKYTRKKIKAGKLDEVRIKEFNEIMNRRDFSEHTGGRKKKEQ